MVHEISSSYISHSEINTVIDNDYQIKLSKNSVELINRCRNYLDEKLKNSDKPIYGINTGFGALHNVSIEAKDAEQLQENLVISHACGIGNRVPNEIVRIMLLLKIQGLSQGHSGVHLDTVQRLIDLFNHKVYPIVYQQGSLGASGDLAPLAHLCLPLLGRGEVEYEGEILKGEELEGKFGWKPIQLKTKEGLALLNGTQFMSAYLTWILSKSKKLSQWSDVIAAISLEGYDGRIEPFDHLVHNIRHHNGQKITAKNILAHTKGSEIVAQEKKHVQDPYSFRCIPQVHGATKDAIEYVTSVLENEINAVTDNPTIFPEEDKIISAGNFHGQPLAITLDFLAIAMAELGSISERRMYKLISGQRGLPAFLVAEPGLNSGFMIPQYTAASIVSKNKQLCTPCSVDTIDSSNGQEDHVSMGANAATKTYEVVQNVEKILAIELYNAAQAIEFRKPLKSSDFLENILSNYRKLVPFVKKDVLMHNDIIKSIEFLSSTHI